MSYLSRYLILPILGLILFSASCATNSVIPAETSHQTPAPTATYSTEGYTANLIQQIKETDPPAFPDIPSNCIWDIPAEVLGSFNNRYAEWIAAQIRSGSPTDIDNVLVIPNGDGLFLVMIPQVACSSSAHVTPKVTVYVMDQTGNRWLAIDQIGQPYPEFEKRVLWDGAKWIMLAHQIDTYWGATSAEFTVWHILRTDQGGWDSDPFEIENNPVLYRPIRSEDQGPIFAEFEQEMLIGRAFHPHCDVPVDNLQTVPLIFFKFNGTLYEETQYGYELNGERIVCHRR